MNIKVTTQVYGAEGILTTDHPLSSHGIPVLILDGEIYSPTSPVKWLGGMPAREIKMIRAEHIHDSHSSPVELLDSPELTEETYLRETFDSLYAAFSSACAEGYLENNMTTYEDVMEHADHQVYWCAECRETFAPSEVEHTMGIREDGSTRCSHCNAILYAEPHLGACGGGR